MAKVPINIKANAILPGVVGYDLHNAIDSSHVDGETSPIDDFLGNCKEINKLVTQTPSPVLANLVILGYVSAIESYFRAIFRKLILIDEKARTACEKRQISYGAALSVEEFMLPEALFEDLSFAGKKNILESFKNLLNLQVQDSQIPSDLNQTLNQFQEICELRHCIVHRFGRFGSKTAITLGLEKHKIHVEKPIKCDYATLQQFLIVCQNTVRITNNYLFERILSRLLIDGSTKLTTPIWTWDYKKDKRLFSSYCNTFISKLEPDTGSTTLVNEYKKYHNYYINL